MFFCIRAHKTGHESGWIFWQEQKRSPVILAAEANRSLWTTRPELIYPGWKLEVVEVPEGSPGHDAGPWTHKK